MEDFIDLLKYIVFTMVGSFLGIIVLLFLCVLPFYWFDSGTYEYVDLDNNKGIATICEPHDSLQICHQKDGTIVSVKKYKKIK